MYPEFPLLTKDQIECKVKKISDKGAVVLLYKTARVDMDMLDRIVGPMNWCNSYRDIDGVMYCSIGIHDPETKEWISKEDCGIESRADGEGTEKKGEASDAFKRAGFRWGIGRELYSAPFTFVRVETKQNGRGNYELADRFMTFSVSHIAYSEDRKISELKIVNNKGVEVFSWKAEPSSVKITPRTRASKAENEPVPTPPTITAVVDQDQPPFDLEPTDAITQDMLTSIVANYLVGKNTEEKRAIAADIKRMNSGSANYKAITDPEIRKTVYNHFWNLMNEFNQ